MIARNRSIPAASILSLALSAWAQAAGPAAADPTAAQTAASPTDAAFLAQAVPAGREEVMAASGALKMSKSAGVKKAAELVHQDHLTANRKLATIARQKGWTLPPADASAAAPSNYSDDAYVSSQIKAHQDAIALFTDEAASGSDPELRAFAQDTLPALRQHLKSMQALQSS
jgi:putative membrane protein